MGGFFVLLLLWVAFGGGIGYWIGSGKGRGGLGFALGLVFGWIGWIIVALLQPTAEVEALRMATIGAALRGDEAVFDLGRPCPWCAEIIKPAASVCRYCNREVQPAPGAMTNAAAVRSESISSDRISGPSSRVHTNWEALIDRFGVSNAEDFDPKLLQWIGRPLHILDESLDDNENILKLASAKLRGSKGLLVATNQRLYFLDGDTGLLELEFLIEGSNAEVVQGVLIAEDWEGSAQFTRIEPNHFQVDPESAAASVDRFPTSDHGPVRICDGCGASFTHVLSSHMCPGCGGILYPIG